MEHMLYKCTFYAEPQWELLAEAISYLAKKFNSEAANLHVTYQNIIYNTEVRNIGMSIKDKNDRIVIGMVIHKLRRKIYLFQSTDDTNIDAEIPLIRRTAHILSVFKQLTSYLSYISKIKWETAITNLQYMSEYLENKVS